MMLLFGQRQQQQQSSLLLLGRNVLLLQMLSLLLFMPVALVYGQWDGSNGCPGVIIDGHAYVTDKSQIRFCEYSISGFAPFPETVNVITDYECWDRRIRPAVHCSGSLVNPNYAFWDTALNQYVDPPPTCRQSIPSCQDLEDVCVPDGPRKCDSFGQYMCEMIDPEDVLWNGTYVNVTAEEMENTTHTEPQPQVGWCIGEVKEPQHYNCPPRVVASFAEVTKYCTSQAFMDNATHYHCEYYGSIVCRGRVDADDIKVRIKPCTGGPVKDCSDAERQRVCKKRVSPIQREFCGSKIQYVTQNETYEFKGNVLECTDRETGNWCQAPIDPDMMKKFYKQEHCPDGSLDYCRDLSKYFYHPEFCYCRTNVTAAPNDVEAEWGFACHHDGKATPWCEGYIEKQRHDKMLNPIPKEHPSATNLPDLVDNVLDSIQDTHDCKTTACKTGKTFFYLVSITGIALMLFTYIRRRKQINGTASIANQPSTGSSLWLPRRRRRPRPRMPMEEYDLHFRDNHEYEDDGIMMVIPDAHHHHTAGGGTSLFDIDDEDDNNNMGVTPYSDHVPPPVPLTSTTSGSGGRKKSTTVQAAPPLPTPSGHRNII